MLLSGMVEPIRCTKELKQGGLYYFLTPNGEVGSSTWYGSASDLALFNTGNCFLSMAEAEAAREKIETDMKATMKEVGIVQEKRRGKKHE